MGVTTINIRLNDEDKKIFNEICNELGLNMSTAFNMFVKSMIRTGGLPFEVKINNFNAETIKALEETNDILTGKISRPVYKTTKELFETLDKED
ncbi:MULTISPECIES: type II toxin-antitoxin system RelB/DinJ family antitoxin [Fusobacterium]|uniref:type II toxin-antitoxin system RelB/DinJ family antitoxin n=1 Tax=Fusobacterium TaxID=848 RepID=UPI000E8148E6|nr:MULTISPECIES: type II toxin-antitoxin system RelB/DinJ family antitoxin [Fusobacterium]HBJ78523.1 type II toxin-antitoxin system antitoxin, RelB/DinJ family [Fusobacterium sp.]